jgi:hypothetical protein
MGPNEVAEGMRVRIKIANRDTWTADAITRFDGAPGVIEEVKRTGHNGRETYTLDVPLVLVRFDSRKPGSSRGTTVGAFHFGPEDLVSTEFAEAIEARAVRS